MTASVEVLGRRIDQARGRERADLVVKGGWVLNVSLGELEEADVAICDDTIVGVGADYSGTREVDARGRVVVPGFIETHVHVESTMVQPSEYERLVLPRGTTTAICDPHEIANVLGLDGLRYFLACAEAARFDLRVQLSSCVPATHLETAGASLSAADLLTLRGHPKALGLAEMMNFPGLLAKDPDVLEKVAAFSDGHIDGHAPLVRGKDLCAYAACGVRNCHESTGIDEAREKLARGLQVLIREGSVAKNLDMLLPLLTERTWPFLAFCTDDRNALEILDEGHLDHMIRRAIASGIPPETVYRTVSWSAARAFRLHDRGMMAPGQRADLVVLDDWEACAVGRVVAAGAVVEAEATGAVPAPVGLDSVKLAPVAAETFRIAAGWTGPTIGALAGSLLTEALPLQAPVRGGERVSDPRTDVLKVAVLERHKGTGNVGRGFVHGFGLQRGALAASVGHDSHNVIVIGASDGDMAVAVNRLIAMRGGFVAVADGAVLADLALPLAGLMSLRPAGEVAADLRRLQAAARDLGCRLAEPFLQLAFLPLPVIPHLKITDKGLVDVDRFELLAA